MTNRTYYIIFFIQLLLLITNKSKAQDTLKIVPGISVDPFIAYTTNASPIGGIDLNINLVLKYGRNQFSAGPVIGQRMIEFRGNTTRIKSGLNGVGWSYQRELLSGKNLYFKAGYHFIYQFVQHEDQDTSTGTFYQYNYSNYLIQQTLGYALGVRIGKHFRLEHHLGAGYGTGKRKIDYFDRDQNPARKIRSDNKGFTMLIKLSLGYVF